MPNISPIHLVIVLIIALIVIGPGKLPEVGAALGKSIKEFRKAASDITDSAHTEAAPIAAATAAVAPAAPIAPAAMAPVAPPPAPLAPAPVAPLPVAVTAPPEVIGITPAAALRQMTASAISGENERPSALSRAALPNARADQQAKR